jgi:hypothetical protein
MARIQTAPKFDEDSLLSDRLQAAIKRAEQGEKRARKDTTEKMGYGDAALCLEKAYCAAVALESGGLEPTLDQVLRVAQFSVLDDISSGLEEDDD